MRYEIDAGDQNYVFRIIPEQFHAYISGSLLLTLSVGFVRFVKKNNS